MARCIGARVEPRTYSACSAIRQVKPGLVDRGSRRVLEELAMGIGVFHVEHSSGHRRLASEPRFVHRRILRLAPYLSPLAHGQHRRA